MPPAPPTRGLPPPCASPASTGFVSRISAERRTSRNENKDGRHVVLDFYDLLIEPIMVVNGSLSRPLAGSSTHSRLRGNVNIATDYRKPNHWSSRARRRKGTVRTGRHGFTSARRVVKVTAELKRRSPRHRMNFDLPRSQSGLC